MNSKDLINLSVEEKQLFINSFDYVLTDCDGTIWQYTCKIENADKGALALKENNKEIYFVTNNSIRTYDEYIETIDKLLGLKTEQKYIINTASTTLAYLKKINFTGLIYVSGSRNFRKILKDAGYEILEGPYEFESSNEVDAIRLVVDKKPVKAVIIDIDLFLTYPMLIRAEMYLRDPDCLFIVNATDIFAPISNNLYIITPGCISKLLQNATKRTPIVLGKPGKELVEVLSHHLKFTDPKKVLFIGDTISQDIAFGKLCGYQTLLVFTGIDNKQRLLTHENSDEWPDYYLNSFADLADIFNELNKLKKSE